MSREIAFEWKGEKLVLLPEKAILLPEHDTLLVADLHFGKTAHFRKNGLPLPAASSSQDFHLLSALLKAYPSKHVYFLGDLFHSEENHEWTLLLNLFSSFSETKFYLIPGNHDLIDVPKPVGTNFISTPPSVQLGKLTLLHDAEDAKPGEHIISGHIHPGFRLKGKARQSIMLPAFYIMSNQILLPAFGALTGLITPKIKGTSQIAVIGPAGVQWVPNKIL